MNPTTTGGWVEALGKETTDDVVYSIYSSQPANHATGYIRKNSVFSEAGASGPLTANTWTHVATTYDGATLRFYVNGTQVGSSAATGPIDSSSGVFRIGGNSIFGEHFDGRIDEVRVYNRALSATQINTDLNAAVVNGTQPPPTTQPPVTTTTGAPTTTTTSPTTPPGTMPGTRDAYLWPFAANSWVNTPVAASATYGSGPFSSANINAESWSVNTGLAGDGTGPGGGSDAHVCLWNAAKTRISDDWNFSAYVVDVDARGSAYNAGTLAVRVPACAGLIRKEELDRNQIPHALALVVDQYSLSNNLKWPANAIDSDTSKHTAGGLWYGALYAIPPSVNVASLGLSAGGLTMAHALQDYGAVIVDQGANNSFYAEGRTAGTSGLAGARADVARLMSYLREITNSTASTPGGGAVGSARRALLAPAFG